MLENLFNQNINELMELKQLEHDMVSVKNEIRNKVSEINNDKKRFVFGDIIIKFDKMYTYEKNENEIKNVLNEYGLLPKTVKIDTKNASLEDLRSIENYKMEVTKNVRVLIKFEKIDNDYSNLTLDQLLQVWKIKSEKINELTQLLETLKRRAKKDVNLFMNGRVVGENFTISIVKNKQEYNIDKMFQEMGADFIKRVSKVSYGKIDEYIENGYIEEKEIEVFKTVTDINLKFVITTKEKEDILFSMLNKNKVLASLKKAN